MSMSDLFNCICVDELVYHTFVNEHPVAFQVNPHLA
jgi:hypothetical protein